MNTRTRITASLAAATLSASALAGCGDDGGGPAPQPVDHQTTRQAVQDNTESASQSLRDSLAYVRQTNLLGEMVGGLDKAGTNCADGGTIEGGTDSEPSGSFECEPAEPVETDIQHGTDELVDFLNTRVFVEANIEQESGTEVTYLLDGQTVCQADDFVEPAEHQECIDDVDQVGLRLVVTSFAQGDVDIDVLVGPDRYRPVDFALHQDAIAATTDLGELRSAMVFSASATGEELPELPTTMQGRLRAELRHDANGTLVSTVSVLQNVLVTGEDYELSVSKAEPAAQITVDSAGQTISGLLDLNPVDLRMPVTETETTWDATTGEETTTETSYELQAHLGGASFEAAYAVGEDRIDVQNIGLGDTTSTIDIDGKRVAAVDLNRNDGRHLNLSVLAGESGVEFSVGPAFDLELMLQLAQVQDKLDDVDDWMLDELLRVTLDGAANPAVRIGDHGVEVLEGRLTLSSTSAGITHEASAGQCLLPPEGDEPEPMTGSGTSDGTSPTSSEESSSHPLEDFSVGACQ